MYRIESDLQKPIAEACEELCKVSKMESFAKIVNGFKPLTIFAKLSILDVWLGSEYTSGQLE